MIQEISADEYESFILRIIYEKETEDHKRAMENNSVPYLSTLSDEEKRNRRREQGQYRIRQELQQRLRQEIQLERRLRNC